MTLAEILAEETAPRGRLAGQRPDQRLAPNADRKLMALGAGLVDPLNIPSAVSGLVSPETRDAWRGVQAEHPGMATVGGIVPGVGAIRAAAAVPTTIGKLLTAMGLGAGSDVIDEAAGVDGATGARTVAKAVTAPVGVVPAKVSVPVIAAGATGVLGAVDPAAAQSMTARQKRRLEERATAASIDAKAEADRAEAASRRAQADKDAEDKRERDKAKVLEATTARDEVLAKARRPFGETEIGGVRVGPYLEAAMPFVPALLGAVTGAKFGKTAAAGDKTAVDAWKEANRAGLAATAPSVKQEQATLAAMLQKPYEGGVPMDRIIKQTAIPTVAGAVEGGAVANMPEFYNSYLPPENPERKALEAYRDRLPIDDKERASVDARIRALPEETPAKTAAKAHFRNGDWIPRSLQGAAEGAGVSASVNIGRRMAPFKDGLGKANAETVQLRNQVGATADDTAELMAKRGDVDARFAEGQAGREVAGAKRATDTERSKAFYGSDEYGDGVTKDLATTTAGEREQLLRAQLAQRQSGAPAGGQPPPGGTGAQVPPVAPVADLQPRAATAPNQAGPSSSPATRLEESTASALPNQPQNSGMITADPVDLSKLINLAIDRLEKTPLAPVAATANRALPPPTAAPGRGRWADDIQPTARDVLRSDADAGGSIASGNAARIGRAIDSALPEAAKRPSAADVRDRVSNLRDIVGDKPSRADLDRVFAAAPDSIYRGKKIPAIVAATGATGAAAALSPEAEASVLDEVMKQYMGGRGLDQITASDVQGKIEDQSAVDGVLGKLRGKVNGLSTKGEQLRAIREARNGGLMESDTSPTGYRDPSGKFAKGDGQ